MLKKTLIWSAITTLLSTAVFASVSIANTPKGVLTLQNQQEFDFAIQHHDLVLMKFFAPWCGHCKAMIPEYEKAATELKSDNITLAEIDCTINGDVCNRYNLKGYPTLQIFRKGRASDVYPHERKANSIVQFMKKHLAASGISLIGSRDNLEKLKNEEALLAVAYFVPADETRINEWRDFSDKLIDDFAFAYVTDRDLAASEQITTFPTVVLYKHFDQLKDIHQGEFNMEAMEDFIKVNSVPLLDDIRPETFMDYVDAKRPLVYLFSDTEEMKQTLHTTFEPVAKKYKGKFSFVHIDGKEYASQADFLSLKTDQYPAMAIHNFVTGARYPFDQEKNLQDTQEVEQFLDNVHAEKITPAIKSQAYPVKSEKDAVKVVVGNDFEKIVMDKSKDVFIEIYAPWCGHCQKLAPTWQQLGEVMQQHNAAEQHDVMVAKMDGTANDVPVSAGFQVTGYPTIKFFKAETNQMVDYKGERTLHDFVKFLNEQSTKKTLNIDLESLPEPKVKRSDVAEAVDQGESGGIAERRDEL